MSANSQHGECSPSSVSREDTTTSDSALLGYLARFRLRSPSSPFGRSIAVPSSPTSSPPSPQAQTWPDLPRLLQKGRAGSHENLPAKLARDYEQQQKPQQSNVPLKQNRCDDCKPLLDNPDDLEAAMKNEAQSGGQRCTARCIMGTALLTVGIVLLTTSLFVASGGNLSVVTVNAKKKHVPFVPKPTSLPMRPPSGLGPAKLNFYMYRAQSDAEYPLQNVNAADLPGVMWYLHNEVVVSVPRKYDVTRILRFKVTMKNTQAMYNLTHTNFGPFVAFDSAKCTVPGCQQMFDKYGFVVGCQNLDSPFQRYTSPSAHRSGAWYSLPGVCPTATNGAKSVECQQSLPGGACRQASDLDDPSEQQRCTYYTEQAGEVRLDELVGIPDYAQFRANGGSEYDVNADKGRGTSFWDGKLDPQKCDLRVERLRALFQRKYPNVPIFMDEPVCD